VATPTKRLRITRPTEQRWEARWFAIGSVCFALGALPGYAQLVGGTADDATYAVGSVFFTIAALVQLLLSPRFKRGAWRSAAWSDWWAAAVQFAGTLLFNLSTFAALFHHLSAQQQNRAIWQPDAYGSAAFLVASLLAVHATTITDRLWDPTSRTWEVTWINLLGSVAFGASALAGYISPNSGDVAHAEAANVGTFLGALCFLAGALLTSPRPDPAGRDG
jgi:predicted membrane channel-forming protein YqfA (hemolysin III family)